MTRLTVVSHAGYDRWRKSLWLCRCACGATCTVRRGDLTSGATRSCGCLRSDVATSLMHDILSRRRRAA